jgi:hypothetical protein
VPPIVDVDANLSGDSTLTAEGLLQIKAVAGIAGTSTFGSDLTVVTGFAAPVRYNPSPRSVQAGRMVLDQVDLFDADGKTRSQGVTHDNLLLRVYAGATQLSWPLVSGVGVQDVQVAAGRVYWTELSTGFYHIRFFPNMVGPWRVLLTYPAFDQATSLSYDVVPQAGVPGGLGLRASFIRRGP